MQINPVSNINHKGIPIADIKINGGDACYKLFSVNHKDKTFLEKMYDSVDLRKLMPKMPDYYHVVWDEVLRNAVRLTHSSGTKSVLETYNNTPCGILNYKEVNNKYHVNYVATFPTDAGKRIPCAGQILFYELFNRFINSDKQFIRLSAIKISPFDPIIKYLRLGFKMRGGDNYCEIMGINRERALETLSKQKKFIEYKSIENTQFVDLNKEIKLNSVV